MYLTCADGEGIPYTEIERTDLKRTIKQGFRIYSKESKHKA